MIMQFYIFQKIKMLLIFFFFLDLFFEIVFVVIENIADVVIYVRFVGIDLGSDEVVFMRILYVRLSFQDFFYGLLQFFFIVYECIGNLIIGI